MLSKPHPATGHGAILYFALAGFLILAFLLSDAKKCEIFDFCSAVIFGMAFLFSLAMIGMFLLFAKNKVGKIDLTPQNVRSFFMQDITIVKLAWIPLSLLGVLAISFSVTYWNWEYASFAGIFFSGLILWIGFIATNNIIIPTVSHGIYNVIVEYLRGVSSPIVETFPNFVISIDNATGLLTQAGWQLFVVAPAEEMFKMLGVIIFTVMLKGRISQRESIEVWASGFIAISIWTLLHVFTM